MFRSLAFAAAIAVLLGAGRAGAQQPLTGDLKLVPNDAAVFGFVDVAKLQRSKFAASLREFEMPVEADQNNFDAKPADPNAAKTVKPYKAFAKQFHEATGVDLESIRTLTFYIPKVKGPGDESTFVLALTVPEYDLDKFLNGLGKLNEEFKEFKQVSPGIVEFKQSEIRLAFPSKTQIMMLGQKVKAIPTEQTAGPGVVSPALEAAASGKTAVLSLNFANFPEELKGDDLPAEVRAFAPLIRSDLDYATFDVDGDKIDATVHVRNENRAKSIEAEKALSALMMFARIGLVEARKQLDKEKENNKQLEPIVGLVANLQDAVKTAKYSSDEKEARLSLSLKADSAFAGSAVLAIAQARGSASRSVTANNLKQIGLAMHNYADATGSFPLAGICDKNGKPLLSWRVAILPYIEQNNLYKQFKLDEPWDSEHNIKLSKYVVKTFMLPNDSVEDGKTRFRVFVGGDKSGDTVFNFKKGSKFAEITDGTSNTIMVVTAKEKVVWTKPDELTFDPKADPSTQLYFQNNITPVLFCDGSVRSIRKGVPEETWRALITKNGGEVANIP